MPHWIPGGATGPGWGPGSGSQLHPESLATCEEAGSRIESRMEVTIPSEAPGPAWSSGIECHMYLQIPIEIRDAALDPVSDSGSGTGSQLLQAARIS